MIDKNSQFYINAKKMLDEYVANGGNIDDLGRSNPEYVYVKDARIKGADGKYMDLEAKFEMLGHPRKPKYKDNKKELIAEINAYKQAGGSFHITRKQLPFYYRLRVYASQLKRNGIDLTYEQVMKGLGYKDYSDTYFRCISLFELGKYRDDNGFVDNYRKDEKLKSYIWSLGRSFDLPYYLVITLIADEKLNKCFIATEYIESVKMELNRYVEEHGSLKGIKRNNTNLYYKLNMLARYYSDGSERDLNKGDLLSIFDLSDVENGFRTMPQEDVDIEAMMLGFKQEFGNRVISRKDIDSKKYYAIVKKAVKLAIPIKELFRNYGLNYKGNQVDRLSAMQVTKIPYLAEMKKFRDGLLEAQGITAENGYCKEEIFEARVKACQQAYNKFKDKMFNFTIDETETFEDVTNF